MTSAPTTPIARSGAQITPDGREHLRLRLKPRAPATGAVDGGWWPRSRDLAVEVPALLAVLAIRLGTVEGVTYNLGDWGPTSRKITVGGARVRIAGYRSQHPDTIDVFGPRHRVTLLVVPPEATGPVAHAALMAAGHRANTDSVEALLLASHTFSVEDAAAEQRWEIDGGPVLVGRA
jgi:hypothetical protein